MWARDAFTQTERRRDAPTDTTGTGRTPPTPSSSAGMLADEGLD